MEEYVDNDKKEILELKWYGPENLDKKQEVYSSYKIAKLTELSEGKLTTTTHTHTHKEKHIPWGNCFTYSSFNIDNYSRLN